MRETESRRLQEGRHSRNVCSRKPLQVHQPSQIAPPPLTWRRSCSSGRSGCPPPGTIGNEGSRWHPSHSGVPRRPCAGESIEARSDPKFLCARQWRKSFKGSMRGSQTFSTPLPQGMNATEGTVQLKNWTSSPSMSTHMVTQLLHHALHLSG